MGIAYALSAFATMVYDSAFTDSRCAGADRALPGASAGLFSPKPGKKKLAGETLLLMFNPPHPVNSSPPRAVAASKENFRSNLTFLEYRYKVFMLAITKSHGRRVFQAAAVAALGIRLL